jgi:hypothetical protein
MIKAVMKLGIEGMYFNTLNAEYEQDYSQNHTKWGKTETISPKVWNERRVPTFLTPVQRSLGISSQSKKARRNKRNIKT